MKRRSFLRIFAGAAAAIATGVVGKAAIVASEATTPVVMLPGNINPAWLNATYETSFIFHPDVIERYPELIS
jgi:spermidine/putrescine-binding protein